MHVEDRIHDHLVGHSEAVQQHRDRIHQHRAVIGDHLQCGAESGGVVSSVDRDSAFTVGAVFGEPVVRGKQTRGQQAGGVEVVDVIATRLSVRVASVGVRTAVGLGVRPDDPVRNVFGARGSGPFGHTPDS